MRMGTFSAFVRLSVTMRQLAEVNWSALFSKVKGAGLQPRGGGAPETFLAEQTKNQPGIVQRLFFKALGARFLGMPLNGTIGFFDTLQLSSWIGFEKCCSIFLDPGLLFVKHGSPPSPHESTRIPDVAVKGASADGITSDVPRKRPLLYTVYLLIMSPSKYSKFCRTRPPEPVSGRLFVHQLSSANLPSRGQLTKRSGKIEGGRSVAVAEMTVGTEI